MKLLRVTISNIKGYHHFKICTTKEIEMAVEKELKNSDDPYAMVIKMPLLSNIPREFHDKVTREILLKNELKLYLIKLLVEYLRICTNSFYMSLQKEKYLR